MHNTAAREAPPADAGFTLIELLVVLAIAGVLFGIGLVSTRNSQQTFRANSAMNDLRARLAEARETAIGRSRTVRLEFIDNNRVNFFQVQPAGGGAESELGTFVLPGTTRFDPFDGDTPPDVWCRRETPTPVLNARALRFNSNGALVNDTGEFLSGCLYINEPNLPNSARAISIFGSTGRMRMFKWDGTAWRR